VPSDSLRLYAAFSTGKGDQFDVLVDGKLRSLTAKDGYTWVAGKLADKAIAVTPAGPALAIADAGDFDRNQPFTVSTWVKTARAGNIGAMFARMDTAANQHRGWDFWMENDKVGMHIINRWPDDALKVTTKQALQPNRWYHVLASYDGSGKAAGVRVYIDGAAQPVDVFTDKLKNTIRAKVPLKVGQRQVGERLKDAALQDVRIYGRALNSARGGAARPNAACPGAAGDTRGEAVGKGSR